MAKTLEELLKKYPPFLVAILPMERARPLSVKFKDYRYKMRGYPSKKYPPRNGWRLKPRSKVAKDSGLHPKTVYRISRQLTWNSINTAEMLAFWKGCEFDILATQKYSARMKEWLKGGMKLLHLNAAERKRFASKVRQYQEYLSLVAN